MRGCRDGMRASVRKETIDAYTENGMNVDMMNGMNMRED